MENPVAPVINAAKSAINIPNIVKIVVGFVVVAVIFDLLGKSNWLIQPVSSFKAWQAAKAA